MIYETYINGALNLRMKIDHQIEKVVRLEEICNKATSAFSERVQNSPTNKREISLTKLADGKTELSKMLEQLESVEKEIAGFLTLNLKRDEADILIYKYIDSKSIQEIAQIKSMAEGSVRNKVAKADKRAKIRFYETYGKEKV